MTFHEPTSPFDYPYRAIASSLLDADGLRVPYRGEDRMRLTLSSGLAHARVVIDPAAQDLIELRGDADGPEPRLRVAAGEITLSWRASWGDWLRGHRDVAIVLHPAVSWTLAIRGGLAHCELDLAAGAVERIELHGGCSQVRFELPLPKTIVPIRISGGASQLVVQRPAEAGVVLDVAGGVAALRLDDQRFGAIGGGVRLETRAGSAGAPRYELQLSGGASELAIEPRAAL